MALKRLCLDSSSLLLSGICQIKLRNEASGSRCWLTQTSHRRLRETLGCLAKVRGETVTVGLPVRSLPSIPWSLQRIDTRRGARNQISPYLSQRTGPLFPPDGWTERSFWSGVVCQTPEGLMFLTGSIFPLRGRICPRWEDGVTECDVLRWKTSESLKAMSHRVSFLLIERQTDEISVPRRAKSHHVLLFCVTAHS